MPTPIRIIVVLLIGFPAFYFWLLGLLAAFATTWLTAIQSPSPPHWHLDSRYLVNYVAAMSMGYFMFEFARLLLRERPQPPAQIVRAVLLNWALQIILLASIFGAAGFFSTGIPMKFGRETCGAVFGISMITLTYCIFLKLRWSRDSGVKR